MNTKNKWLLGVVSATLISAATLWEGTRYTPYEDIAGVLTVCQGYTGKDIVRNKRYTPEECNAYLVKELNTHARGVLNCVNVPLTQYQYDAFVLFAYNMGVGNFCSSAFLREFNKGNTTKACNMMATHPNGQPAWSYAAGKYVQGLQNRRQFEKKMCLGEMNASKT